MNRNNCFQVFYPNLLTKIAVMAYTARYSSPLVTVYYTSNYVFIIMLWSAPETAFRFQKLIRVFAQSVRTEEFAEETLWRHKMQSTPLIACLPDLRLHIYFPSFFKRTSHMQPAQLMHSEPCVEKLSQYSQYSFNRVVNNFSACKQDSTYGQMQIIFCMRLLRAHKESRGHVENIFVLSSSSFIQRSFHEKCLQGLVLRTCRRLGNKKQVNEGKFYDGASAICEQFVAPNE